MKKAYTIHDGDEGWCIQFAERAVVARRQGAQELDIEFGEVDTCYRTPWGDEFAESGVIPAAVAVANGWHFECQGCGVRIDDDDEFEKPVAGVVGTMRSAVFCDAECRDSHELHRAECKAREARAIRWLKRRVLRRFPGVQFVDEEPGRIGRQHAYAARNRHGRVRVEQAFVSFHFPGAEIGPASLRYEPREQADLPKIYFTCCSGDRDAFQAFADATRPQPVEAA